VDAWRGAADETAYNWVIEPLDPPALIVTAAAGGELAGCLVTFSSPCSIDPPLHAVWLSHPNHTYRVALRSRALILHVLTREDLELAELFGGVSGNREDKFARASWSLCEGTPLLSVGGGWLRGRVVSRTTTGDHTCFVVSPDVTGAGAARGGIRQSLRLSDVRHIRPGNPV
jgi:flavin reductase (DIM6/NTAB) family NADH-FMN oxidoreductase RutF